MALVTQATAGELAAGDTLLAVYIDSNLAQARRDSATGEIQGPAADLARELAKRHGIKVTIAPAPGVAGVIASVKSGEADIGFVAYDATRAKEVDFSQNYLLAHNTYIVREDSADRQTRHRFPQTRWSIGRTAHGRSCWTSCDGGRASRH